MLIGVPSETAPGERRVALVPDTVARLIKAGNTVVVQRGAGTAAAYRDDAYEAAGAMLAADAAEVFAKAGIVVKVARPSSAELARMHAGQTLIAFLAPLGDPRSVEAYATRKITALSMDAIPRTTKAQSMDALSSQANIAGYKAVLIAAASLAKYFPMLTTAAGTIKPAQVLVIGAGVAGLQAIATARRLGAVVTGYDARTAVKEQVQSLGAKFLEIDVGESAEGSGGYARELSAEALERQRAAMVKAIGAADVVITTAAVPGKRAPLLVTREAVAAMAPGSIVVDLAAETGGNCELTRVNEWVASPNGVTIVGTTNLPSTVATHASQLYSKNVLTLLEYIIKDGLLNLDMEDEIVRGTTLARDGEIVHEPTLAALQPAVGETA
ncbi:MAG: Re/Si-specific NAD(P)(+) transhydrogenase subunit alpha [Candidatus Eremiobacteraeota bacterium]|nr:Re/Si-specific NAD(P)(+) transhydrogenase subunit alpha [Candidatus Eremiobacteraeota bacterium]MBC5803182.1 Re/Si-specific NAD(P)(+) transhydrogenase subunit alpha [Candidatus Eremiobacteraeota bacterium]